MPQVQSTKPKPDKSQAPAIVRFHRKIIVNQESGCHEWQGGTNEHGYGIMLGHDKRLWKAHRWIYFYTNPSSDLKLCVLHKCDNPKCCNPDHLFLGTLKDNSQDCSRKGRFNPKRGTSQCWAKLNDEKVREARIRSANGEKSWRIAKDFGVDHKSIEKCVRRETWAHIE